MNEMHPRRGDWNCSVSWSWDKSAIRALARRRRILLMTAAGADAIAAALTRVPGPSRVDVVPDKPGSYAWWVTTDHLADSYPPIPLEEERIAGWTLVYVGIAPDRLGGRRTLRSRIAKDHTGGTIGNSTFRQSMASLFRDHLGLVPLSGYDRSRVVDERPLTEWLSAHCGLTTIEMDAPWLYEERVIATLGPPLNIKHGTHPFRHVVSAAREQLRRDCGVIERPLRS